VAVSPPNIYGISFEAKEKKRNRITGRLLQLSILKTTFEAVPGLRSGANRRVGISVNAPRNIPVAYRPKLITWCLNFVLMRNRKMMPVKGINKTQDMCNCMIRVVHIPIVKKPSLGLIMGLL